MSLSLPVGLWIMISPDHTRITSMETSVWMILRWEKKV